MIDATRLAPKLWMSSQPPKGYHLHQAGFDVLCLCAEEFQPRLSEFPGLHCVLHAPLEDGPLDNSAIDIAVTTALDIQEFLLAHDRILITCMAGRNRSGLVAALVLHLMTGSEPLHCVMHIKKTRVGIDGEPALTNPYFIEFLRTFRLAG